MPLVLCFTDWDFGDLTEPLQPQIEFVFHAGNLRILLKGKDP
jgi:hypothetical protein